jgi:integrase
LNPGCPAPQAGALIRTRRRAPDTGLRHKPETKPTIINTLLKLKASGIQDGTLYQVSYQLKKIATNVNLENPEEVKAYISTYPAANSYKNNLLKAYAYYASINGINWKRPHFHYERKIPLIPTTESVNKIIAASSKKFATIFTILAETGLEGKELENTTRKDIDSEQGIINAQGCKKHNSRPIKLTPKTADMLREYLHKYTDERPFPSSQIYSEIWRRTRNKLAQKLQEPQLKNVKLQLLRHYQATKFYDKTKDIIATKNRLGHKKIETTMLYTQLIAFNEEEEYTCKTATNLKEATDLIEHGFQYVTTIECFQLFKKRK